MEKKRHTSTMEIRLSMQKALKANLSEQARKGLLERRSGNDRRGWGRMPDIPFHDSSGVIVSNDRRVTPERRVSSLQIGWDEQATSASVTVVHKNAGMADFVPEDGLFTNSSELQDELNALANNMDDLVEDEYSDLMDESEVDYFDQPDDKHSGK